MNFLLTAEDGVRKYFAVISADFPTLHPQVTIPSP